MKLSKKLKQKLIDSGKTFIENNRLYLNFSEQLGILYLDADTFSENTIRKIRKLI